MTRNNKKKVLVALSGGIDSAVAAAILKERGFEVVGVFFDFLNPPRSPFTKGGGEKISPFTKGERKGKFENAKKIAKKLGISLKIVNARKEFRKKIIEYFINGYKKGLTPNPCVVCNREMKFDLLFKLMKKEKADFIATGHYARLRRKVKSQKLKVKIKENPFYNLLEAKDKTKDQSYFLYKLTQRELPKIIFPLGNYTKNEVRNIAKKLKLPVEKRESQDICFLEGKTVEKFLEKKLVWKRGRIRETGGKYLGLHRGLPFYTIGQRRGIEIGGAGPYFVIGKNARKNELVVSNDPRKLLTKKFEVGKANWADKRIKFPLSAKVQIRYHSERISAIIRKGKLGRFIVELKKPARAVTPGQSAVFYKNREVLGGGVITS